MRLRGLKPLASAQQRGKPMQTNEYHEPKMQRTSCQCDICKSYCKVTPGMLTPSDLIRLFCHFTYDSMSEFAHAHLMASPGALMADSFYTVVRIPTLVPASTPAGVCHWLTPDEKCMVHEVKPSGCAYFDHSQDQKTQATISLILHETILGEWFKQPTNYTALWFDLYSNGKLAPPVELLWSLRRYQSKLSNQALN